MSDYEETSRREHQSKVVVTPQALVVTLTPELRQRAEECIERSGAVSFEIRPVSVENLEGSVHANGVLID
jgi:hypothetical protein